MISIALMRNGKLGNPSGFSITRVEYPKNPYLPVKERKEMLSDKAISSILPRNFAALALLCDNIVFAILALIREPKGEHRPSGGQLVTKSSSVLISKNRKKFNIFGPPHVQISASHKGETARRVDLILKYARTSRFAHRTPTGPGPEPVADFLDTKPRMQT